MAEYIAIAMALTAVTVGTVSAVENYQQQKAEAQNAEENARLQMAQMEYNKRMEEREAAAVEAEGQENARRMREAAEEARAQRIAMLGKSGAAMTSGSPLAILGAAAADEEVQIRDAQYNASRQQAQHMAKAADYGYGASIAKQNILAAKASRPTTLSLVNNITGAAISPFVSYSNYQKAGNAVAQSGKSILKTIGK